MGSVFTFVSSDLKKRIDILQNLYNDNQESYHSIKSMIDYEKDNNILEKAIHVNGSRTLLRLHRGLGNLNFKIFLISFYKFKYV